METKFTKRLDRYEPYHPAYEVTLHIDPDGSVLKASVIAEHSDGTRIADPEMQDHSRRILVRSVYDAWLTEVNGRARNESSPTKFGALRPVTDASSDASVPRPELQSVPVAMSAVTEGNTLMWIESVKTGWRHAEQEAGRRKVVAEVIRRSVNADGDDLFTLVVRSSSGYAPKSPGALLSRTSDQIQNASLVRISQDRGNATSRSKGRTRSRSASTRTHEIDISSM